MKKLFIPYMCSTIDLFSFIKSYGNKSPLKWAKDNGCEWDDTMIFAGATKFGKL